MNWPELIMGASLTAFGVFLTYLYDLGKTKKETKESSKRLEAMLRNNLSEMKTALDEAEKHCSHELEILEDNKTLVIALPGIKFYSYSVVMFERPDFMKGDLELEKSLLNLSYEIDLINELIKSRQFHKDNNGAMTNYNSRLKNSNGTLIGLFERTNQTITDALTHL